MSKKNQRANKVEDKEQVIVTDNSDEQVVVATNDVVFVRVVQNFNDAKDNERFISAGPNTFYRTNKERADMLVEAGYCEYADGTTTDSIVVEEPKTDGEPNVDDEESKTDGEPNVDDEEPKTDGEPNVDDEEPKTDDESNDNDSNPNE